MIEMSTRTHRILVWSLLAVGVLLVASSRTVGEPNYGFNFFDCGACVLFLAVYCAVAWLPSRRNRSGEQIDETSEATLPQVLVRNEATHMTAPACRTGAIQTASSTPVTSSPADGVIEFRPSTEPIRSLRRTHTWLYLVAALLFLEYVAFFYFVARNQPLRPPEGRRFGGTFRYVFPPSSKWSDPRRTADDNLLMQSGTWPLFHAINFVVLFYACRAVIIQKAGSQWEAIAWYWLLLVGSLPYLWLLVEPGWNNGDASDLHCWINAPVALLTVPTMCFCLINASNLRGAALVTLTVSELVLLPVWIVIWFVAAVLLGLCQGPIR